MQEIRGAVQGVDDPDRVGVAADAGFLGEDGVVGIVFLDFLDHGRLGRAIGVTDEIVVSLLLDLDLVEFVEVPDKDCATAARRHHGHIL